jgi:aerobic-type carbon monoxide dehydrogenase small subunit (CoxS/CutS family)
MDGGAIMSQMITTTLVVNGTHRSVTAHPDTPLLWVLRENIKLTGTKIGCGAGQCGACTVHVDGRPAFSCLLEIQHLVGKSVTTIEGLSPDSRHPLQRAWIAEQVPQCGYCQSGQIMAAAVLLSQKPDPTDRDIDLAMSGNICRCGTYPRIRHAIHTAARLKAEGGTP